MLIKIIKNTKTDYKKLNPNKIYYKIINKIERIRIKYYLIKVILIIKKNK